MLRLAGCDDPLLGRPLALYDTVSSAGEDGPPDGIDIVYLVLGKMTRRLAEYLPGQALDVWGPLGNGFKSVAAEHVVMVAGGIGQTPFLALAREYLGRREYGQPARRVAGAGRVTLCYGTRTKDYLAGLDDFARLGVEVLTSTDDGSAGQRGLVTQLAQQVLEASPRAAVFCCGPEPMMAAMSRIAGQRNVACQVSLESPMACGIGICFSCVAKVRDADGGWDYRRTCVEGPVFDASKIEWHA
jgi:dihydroorotate dehydrogenase electron transfer subunit